MPKTLLTVPSLERRSLPGAESWTKKMKPESSSGLSVLCGQCNLNYAYYVLPKPSENFRKVILSDFICRLVLNTFMQSGLISWVSPAQTETMKARATNTQQWVLIETAFVTIYFISVLEICLLFFKKMTSLSNNDSEVQENKTNHKGSDKSNLSFSLCFPNSHLLRLLCELSLVHILTGLLWILHTKSTF